MIDKNSKKSDEELAKEQLDEVFPHGFSYPASGYVSANWHKRSQMTNISDQIAYTRKSKSKKV